MSDDNNEIIDVGGNLPSIVESTEPSVVWSTRRWVALALAAVTAALAGTLLVGVLTKRITATEAKDLGAVLLTPLFTILSAAVTFIFSDKAGS